jgi:hypothetical protein
MKSRLWVPAMWVMKNKLKLMFGNRDITLEEPRRDL